MNLTIFPGNHVPPTQFSPGDFDFFRNEIIRVLDPHRSFIKKYFSKGNLVSLKGYTLEKVADGHYEALSKLEVWLLIRGLEYLGCLDEEDPIAFREAIKTGDEHISILWLADIEPNLVRCLQLYNRVAKKTRDQLNTSIYNFRDNLRYYGYFDMGNVFYLHELDHLNQPHRKTTRGDIIKATPKLITYLNRAGCKFLQYEGNANKKLLR